MIHFADDLTFMTTDKSPPEAEICANWNLAKLENWATKNKAHFIETISSYCCYLG